MENFDTKSVKTCILNVISQKDARVHFVGVLGAGMLPLARLLAARGIRVSGTDRASASVDDPIYDCGILFTPYHTANDLKDVELVVYSLAIPTDAPELLYAREHNIPTVTRAELLGAIVSRYQTSIAVAGTHGKSTTVAILTHILNGGGFSPTVISGAPLLCGDSLVIGGDDLVVVEACEYKNAYHSILPTIALVTNIDYDHVDCFDGIDAVSDSFRTFIGRAGQTFLNMACNNSSILAAKMQKRVITYGTSDSEYGLVYYSLGEYKTDFIMKIDGALCSFSIPVAGVGCLYDAVGAIAVAHRLGVPVSKIRDSISTFFGIDRRIQFLGYIDGRAFYYDYAHHPREIENTIDVLMRRHNGLSVIFRPHTYSRTAALMGEFVRVLSLASNVTLLDVFAAREIPTDGSTSNDLAKNLSNATVCDSCTALNFTLSRPGGAIVLMGAGDVDEILSEINNRLNK